jgi:hypothetical protein
MATPDWLKDVGLKEIELKGYLEATKSYIGLDPSEDLYKLWEKIGRLGAQISEIYRKHLP